MDDDHHREYVGHHWVSVIMMAAATTSAYLHPPIPRCPSDRSHYPHCFACICITHVAMTTVRTTRMKMTRMVDLNGRRRDDNYLNNKIHKIMQKTSIPLNTHLTIQLSTE